MFLHRMLKRRRNTEACSCAQPIAGSTWMALRRGNSKSAAGSRTRSSALIVSCGCVAASALRSPNSAPHYGRRAPFCDHSRTQQCQFRAGRPARARDGASSNRSCGLSLPIARDPAWSQEPSIARGSRAVQIRPRDLVLAEQPEDRPFLDLPLCLGDRSSASVQSRRLYSARNR